MKRTASASLSFLTILTLGSWVAGAPARGEALSALSPVDARLYAQAFDAAERGDIATVDQDLLKVSDPCLVGRVQYLKLVRAGSPKPSYNDLAQWLSAFKDLPGADIIYALALKLRPPGDSLPTPVTALTVDDGQTSKSAPQSRATAAAREAYYGGDMPRALTLAVAAKDDWIAGLADWRLAQFADAMDHFGKVASDRGRIDGDRAAGAFWAARSAQAVGQPDRAQAFLRSAASLPATFYGMIARRHLELADDPLARLLQAPEPEADDGDGVQVIGLGAPNVMRLVQTDPRARRAIALMQIGRAMDAGLELRTGLALAEDDEARAAWTILVGALDPNRAPGAPVSAGATIAHAASAYYPTPKLEPLGGFTVDRALVYALAWQESRFNALAVSPVGAIGLMQVMPASAAAAIGDDALRTDPIPLFDPSTNLRAGQDYVTWLMERAVGPDILRAVAAYNGGPATLARTQASVGGDDSLLIVESLPYAETRAYVRSVMAAYWSYRRQFGSDSKTLDALASGRGFIDAKLDR